jgi:ribonuclease HII
VPSFEIEQQHWAAGRRFVAGLDEAGRGCRAGPVVAAAGVLPPDARLPGLDDSKKLTPERREAFFGRICAEALAVGVGQCSPEEIDRLNVLHASLEAMRRAVADLALAPHALLVDGDRPLATPPCAQQTVVRGDTRSLSIAAASVVAKVTRDRLMVTLDGAYPHYGWAVHKGYPTPQHYAALAAHGPSPHHRRSFRLTP